MLPQLNRQMHRAILQRRQNLLNGTAGQKNSFGKTRLCKMNTDNEEEQKEQSGNNSGCVTSACAILGRRRHWRIFTAMGKRLQFIHPFPQEENRWFAASAVPVSLTCHEANDLRKSCRWTSQKWSRHGRRIDNGLYEHTQDVEKRDCESERRRNLLKGVKRREREWKREWVMEDDTRLSLIQRLLRWSPSCCFWLNMLKRYTTSNKRSTTNFE